MGVALRGRAVGCAQAPQAGLPPRGPPSLTQNAAEVARTSATADSSRKQLHAYSDQDCTPLRCTQRVRPSQSASFGQDRLRNQLPVCIDQQLSSTSRRKHDLFVLVDQSGNRPRRTKMCDLADHASGEGPAPLSNGLSLVQARPSTINPQGVRYASVRPLRLRLRGDRGRPRTRRRLSSGDGPRRKTGAFRCRTILRSLRTMPSIWPAR